MMVQAKKFSDEDQLTWKEVLERHARTRDKQICDIFLNGVRVLNLSPEKIPELDEINQILKKCSGFEGILVEGLEEGPSFYKMLAQRKFPVGNFVRSRNDLSYTPAPDIIHDLYGHLPFYTSKSYADFCQSFGEAAITFTKHPDLLRQFERFFWFTAEFGLVKTQKGLRVFGAGIASSVGEIEYALSGKPEVLSFDIDRIRHQEFRIDQMQPLLFCLESPEQLYQSLPELCRRIRKCS